MKTVTQLFTEPLICLVDCVFIHGRSADVEFVLQVSVQLPEVQSSRRQKAQSRRTSRGRQRVEQRRENSLHKAAAPR